MRLLIFLIVFVAGCASKQFIDGDQAPEGIRKKFPALSASDCRKHSGTWRQMPDTKVFRDGGYCMVKTADAGKICQSSGECQSYCELSIDESKPRCAPTIPPRWDRCVPGYYEKGKILGRGECFGEDSEVE
jgi:hypothetical protein